MSKNSVINNNPLEQSASKEVWNVDTGCDAKVACNIVNKVLVFKIQKWLPMFLATYIF